MKPLLSTVALVGLVAMPAAARQANDPADDLPRLTNGRIESHAVVNGVQRDFQAVASTLTAPAWVGYAAPMIPGDRQMCDWSDRVQDSQVPAAPVHLEPAAVFFVLFRVESRQVVRIRPFSVDCPLDGGGRNLHWFTNVAPADSIAFLTTFVSSPAPARVTDNAVAAMAMHEGAAALDALIALARDQPSGRVRGNALFWLAQRAGQKAVGTIAAAIDNDPDTAVKKKAVFALSQLPRDEGVPLLIQQARTNRNPAVRKQAMFWLGQSKDPRALKFFEEILQ
jgi:hypothetical protein